MGLAVAALVKQVPRFEAMALGPDGRLVRDGLELEMNPYCRRAVAQGTELAATTGGSLHVLTLGPPAAEDCLREALAWADARGVVAHGWLVSDLAFAGSDTLATARALDCPPAAGTSSSAPLASTPRATSARQKNSTTRWQRA